MIIIVRTAKHRLQEFLALRQKQHIVAGGRVSAAVLLPIYYKQGQHYILFTRRTEKVKEHRGEISFPGGAYQEEDKTLMNTALRECAEEIGLFPSEIEMLGELDDVLTMTSNYVISPFVGFIAWPYQVKLDRWETDELIEVPISALLDKDCQRQETKVINATAFITYFYNYEGRVIWGATARMLNQFLDIFAQVMA